MSVLAPLFVTVFVTVCAIPMCGLVSLPIAAGAETSRGQATKTTLDLAANLCDSVKLQDAIEHTFGSSVSSCNSDGSFKLGAIAFVRRLRQAAGYIDVISTTIFDTRHEGNSGVTPIDGPQSFYGKGKYRELPSIAGYRCYGSQLGGTMDCFIQPGVVIGVTADDWSTTRNELVPPTDQQLEAVERAMVQAMRGQE